MKKPWEIVLLVIAIVAVVWLGWYLAQSYSQNRMMPGSDRDSHGCIPSAGYSWCEAKQQCVRVWETPCE